MHSIALMLHTCKSLGSFIGHLSGFSCFLLLQWRIFVRLIGFFSNSMGFIWFISFQILRENEIRKKAFLQLIDIYNCTWKFLILIWFRPVILCSSSHFGAFHLTMADNKLTTADNNPRITEPLTMEDINSRVKELEAQLKRMNETVENTRSNLLEQINQINDILKTLKQQITPFQESSHSTMTNSIKQQVRNVKLATRYLMYIDRLTNNYWSIAFAFGLRWLFLGFKWFNWRYAFTRAWIWTICSVYESALELHCLSLT